MFPSFVFSIFNIINYIYIMLLYNIECYFSPNVQELEQDFKSLDDKNSFILYPVYLLYANVLKTPPLILSLKNQITSYKHDYLSFIMTRQMYRTQESSSTLLFFFKCYLKMTSLHYKFNSI